MRTIRNLALCILHFAFVFAAALSGFAKTFDVDISTGRPAASNGAYYHGETIEFRAVRGRSVVTNIEYASIYYQTNGMGDVWWRTDGLTFHPTNDVGAASYRFFMEGREQETGNREQGTGNSPVTSSPLPVTSIKRDWHANGLLRLLPSPGFTPNTLEHPVLTLDFSGIEVLNPPYYDKAETEAKIVELAPAPGNYAAVSNAAVHAAITNALQDTALAGKASVADATLTERGFSEWSILHTPLTAEQKAAFYNESADAAQNDYAVSIGGSGPYALYVGAYNVGSLLASGDGDTVSFSFGSPEASIIWGPVGTVVATRTALPGYQLGSQTDKPLASEAEAAANRAAISTLSDSISTLNDTKLDKSGGTMTGSLSVPELDIVSGPEIVGIFPKYMYITGVGFIDFPSTSGTFALSSDISAAISPTSPAFSNAVLSVGLGIDTNTVAVINELVDSAHDLPVTGATSVGALLLALAAAVAALKKRLSYALGTPIVINTASSEVVEGQTVYYGAATLADRTANIIQVTAATPLDELRITFPAATSGKVRDFGLRVEIGTGSAALAAPSLVPIAPTGETIKIENNAAEIPALADGTATAKGVTLLYFSETAPGVFVVKGEQVEEVA